MLASPLSMQNTRAEETPILATGLRVLSTLFVFGVCAGFPPAPVKAHPHVWVNVQTQVLYGSKGDVTGLRHTWTFDEFYSVFATQGMDTNRDGKYSDEELAPLAEENVNSLSEFEYFTFVRVNGELVERLDPRDYSLDYADGILTLHMTIPLETPVDARKAKVEFEVYDPTYFVAFSFDKANPLMLAASAPSGCAPQFVEQKVASVDAAALSEAFYSELGPDSDFGVQFAQTVEIACNAR